MPVSRTQIEVIVRQLARPLLLLAAIGFLSIAASGAVAEVMGQAAGAHFVAGQFDGITYTEARCADFLEYLPNAASCTAAADEHHFGEVVQYRMAMLLPGLLCFGGWLFVRRQPFFAARSSLADCVVAGIGTTLFSAATGLLLLQGLAALVFNGGSGAGQWLSGGIVALPVAAYYLAAFARTFASAEPTPATSTG